MANKIVKKNVRFDFYETHLKYNPDSLRYFRDQLLQDFDRQDDVKKINLILSNLDKYDEIFTLEDTINHIRKEVISAAATIRDKVVEIDTKSFMPKDEKDQDVIYFQMVNNRDVNIPDKRKIGAERIPIDLDDDEYIGEFMGILYHLQTATAMIQVNRHALVLSQVEEYFTQKRFESLNQAGVKNGLSFCQEIYFAPITDPDEIERMRKSKNKVSFTLKGSDISLSAFAKQTQALSLIPSTFYDTKGVMFTVSISVDTRKKTSYQPLDDVFIEDVLDGFNKVEDHQRPNIEVGFKEDRNSPTEIVNWLVPKMYSKIAFSCVPRKSLGYEVVYVSMLQEFRKKAPRIAKINYNKFIPKK